MSVPKITYPYWYQIAYPLVCLAEDLISLAAGLVGKSYTPLWSFSFSCSVGTKVSKATNPEESKKKMPNGSYDWMELEEYDHMHRRSVNGLWVPVYAFSSKHKDEILALAIKISKRYQ